MSIAQRKPVFDLAAYMDWEETQPERHEYLSGEVFAMTGGTDVHYTIIGNVFSALRESLNGSPCKVFVTGMKVRVDKSDAVFYPDVFVTCDARDRLPEADLAKSHPALAVEVLSASTGAYDRGRKFEIYQQIHELQEYLLIEQDRQHADLFRRNAEGRWVLYPADSGDHIELSCLGISVSLADCYDDVDLASRPFIPAKEIS